MKIRFVIGSLVLLASGCASYYQLQGKFNTYFEQGKYNEAEEMLAKQKKADERKNRLLYFFNRGLVSFLKGDHEVSNEFFEQAVLFYETETKKLGIEILSNFSNPNIAPYYGESFEHLYVHYYKALNYLYLNQFESALVECRRLTTKLYALSDENEGKAKFKNSAYFQNFIGMVYEATKDYNNAFVAYRNAYKIYESDYSDYFNVSAPLQLKKDLVRAALKGGVASEFDYYIKQFGFNERDFKKNDQAEALVFWHNGLAPLKEEWSLEFVSANKNGELYFINSQFGYSVRIPDDQASRPGISDVKMIRVAFPRYVERKTLAKSATLMVNGSFHQFELAEPLNDVAFRSLEDRIAKEVGKAVLRMVVKKATEIAARDQNNDLGAVLGAVNFFTEYADTRNWQTLPNSLFYTRVKLNEGEQKLTFQTDRGEKSEITMNARANRTYFHVVRSLGAEIPNLSQR